MIATDIEKNMYADENLSSAFSTYVDNLAKLNVHSLIIRRDNQNLAEIYWQPYNAKQKQIMYSVSKSFTAVAMMFLVQDKLCSLTTPIYQILKHKVNFVPNERVQRATIRDLLTMTYGFYEEGIQKFYLERDWIKEALSLPLQNEPGKVFFYDNRCPFLCSAIVQELTGKNLLTYLQEKLFNHLAIYDVSWEQNEQGYDKGSYGLSITTADLAKFGQFILNKGKWQHKQLLESKYIEQLLTVHVDTDNELNKAEINDNKQGYGYYFWKCMPDGVFRASGLFGQLCIIFPKEHTVIAITSGAENEQKEAILQATWRFMQIWQRLGSAKRKLNVMHNYKIALPTNDNYEDGRLFSKHFDFADNKLGIKTVQLTRIDTHKLKISLSIRFRQIVLYASNRQWQTNSTTTAPKVNDEFDSCSTIWFDNPYMAYGWHKGELTLKLVYNQGIFIDTIKLKYLDNKLNLQYIPKPSFTIRADACNLQSI